MGVDIVQVGVAVFLGVVLAYILLSRQRSAYKAHVAQLQPKKKAKPAYRADYRREEVAQHKTRDDAWVVIRDKGTGENRVYDLTEYVDEHPGGPDNILLNVGGDSTQGFHGPQHPATVFQLLEDFCIGKLAE